MSARLRFAWLRVVADRPQRAEDARFQHFGFGFDPVFEGATVFLAAFVVILAGLETDFPLQHVDHELLALAG